MKTTKRKLACIVCICVMFLASVPLWYRATEGGGVGALGGGGPSPVNTGYEPWYYYVGDMVNSGSGNLFLHETDLSVGARGYRMQIVRAYNSENNALQGPLGYGWTYNFNLQFAPSGLGDLLYYDGDGSKHLFTLNRAGGYDAPAGKSLRLTALGMGLILWEKTGTKYHFDHTYALTRIEDKNGNNLIISYDISSRITSIADDSNLMLSFAYNGSHISQITDALNRTVKYSYDVNGNLINVTYPNNGVIEYTYYNNHLMNYIVDQVGKKTRFVFDTPRPASHARVRSIYHSALIGGNESLFYEAYNLTYAPSVTTVRNAMGNTAAIYLNSNGSATKIDGPATGSIFFDDFEGGEAQETPPEPSSEGSSTSLCTSCSLKEIPTPYVIQNPARAIFRNLASRSNSVEIGWDADFNIESLKDAVSNSYNITYSPQRDPSSVVDPSENTTAIGWTVQLSASDYTSRLKNVTDPENSLEQYSYDHSENLISFQNARGDWINYSRDTYGFVKNMTDFWGGVHELAYDSHGFFTAMTNPLNETTLYGRDLVGRNVNTTSPGGNKTSFFYDDMDNLVGVTDAMGNTTNMTYNLRNDLVDVKDARGHWLNYSIDTVLGRVVSVTDESGNKTSYSYNNLGDLTSWTCKRNFTKTYAYDTYRRLTSVTDATGNATGIQYYQNGLAHKIVDRENHTTTFAYDSVGRPVNVTDRTGNSTEFSYDEVGNIKTIKNALGNSLTFAYNEFGRVTNLTDASGNSTLYEYDEMGNVKKMTDAMGRDHLYEYDALGRLKKMTDPLNQTTQYTYDSEGNMVNSTDANGHSTLLFYDGLGRIVNRTSANGHSTEFSYDAIGNIIQVKDAKGLSINFTYDDLNRLINWSSPSGSSWILVYDANGNTVERKDPNGHTTTYQYDSLNRLILVSYPNGLNISCDYDANGRVVRIDNSSGYYENRTYDPMGRPLTVQVSFASLNKTISYSYDNVGNRAKVTYPDGKNVSYQYDVNNRVVAITDWSNDTWTFEYDPVGRRTRLEYPTGVNASYSYNNASWLTAILVRNSSNVTLMNLSYSYDGVGNILEGTDRYGNVTYYVYDDDNQLVQTNGTLDGLTNYSYDAVGNRIKKVNGSDTTDYSYNLENQLTSDGSYNYSYDTNGNMMSGSGPAGTTNYSYDFENRLTKTMLPDNTSVLYGYSSSGSLIERTASNSTSLFVYDLAGHQGLDDLFVEYNSTGSVVSRFVHGPGSDEPLKRQEGTDIVYYHQDLVWSVRMLTNSTGQVDMRIDYSDFGEPSSTSPLVDYEPFVYTGRAWDNDTKIHDYRARSYDSSSGRFLQRDPLRSALRRGLSLYAYVGNNPIVRNDPSGRDLIICYFEAEGYAKEANDKYGYKDDKWRHAYVGCKMGKAFFCTAFDITLLAAGHEFWNNYKEDDPVSPWDIMATLKGAEWSGEGYWSLCRYPIIGGYYRCWREDSCTSICNSHNDYWVWLDEEEARAQEERAPPPPVPDPPPGGGGGGKPVMI